MNKNKKMKGINENHLSGLWFLGIILSCISVNYLVHAEPLPIPPGLIYTDNYADDAESFLLLQRLKQIAERKHEAIEQVRELDNAEMEIQAIFEAESRRNQADYSATDHAILPKPSPIVHNEPAHSGKRTSYMSLCHFKICNMGRKRQL